MDIDNTRPLVRDAGEEVRFVVTVNAFPDINAVEMKWHKDGKPLEVEENNPKRVKMGVTGSQNFLTISKVNLDDSGIYTLIGNSTDMVSNISMTLLVRGSPSVKVLNSQKFYMNEDFYNLTCSAVAFPKATVWWRWYPCSSPKQCSPKDSYFGWVDVDPTSNVSLKVLRNDDEIFYFNETVNYKSSVGLTVLAKQSGIYRCYAHNRNGTRYTQIPFIVTGRNLPIQLIS